MNSRITRTAAATAGGGEHLVSHLLDAVEVDTTCERIQQHRLDDLVPIAGQRGRDRRLLGRGDASQPLREHGRETHLIARAQPVTIGDAHRLDHDIGW